MHHMKQGEGVNKEKWLTKNALQTVISQSDSNLCVTIEAPAGAGEGGGRWVNMSASFSC